MPATGRDLSRRTLLLAAGAVCARAADPAQECWDALTAMAAALGRSDPGEFLAYCDRAMPDYETLRTNVIALVAQAEIESGVDPVRNMGDAAAREVEVDWLLHIVERGGLGKVTRRQQTVKCGFVKQGRKWRARSIAPIAFFAPPSV